MSDPVPSAEALQTFWDLSIDLLSIASTDGRFLHVNDAWERVLGWTPEELTAADNALEFIHPDDAPRVAEELAGLTEAGGRTVDYELRFRTSDGGFRWLRVNSATTDDGELIYGVSTDITERKFTEAQLRESEQRFRLAMEHAPIGKGLVDLEGRWLQVNRALCDIVGYSEEELLQLRWQDITHPEDLQADLGQYRRLLANEARDYALEKRYLHKQGHVIWILLTVALIRDDGGEPLYAIAQIQDITDRKHTQQELDRTLAELERSNADLAEFAQVASHDLKSPLHTIRGYLDLLRDSHGDALGEEGVEFLERASTNVERLTRLVDALLQMARSRSLPFEPEPLSLRDVVATAIGSLESELNDVEHEIDIDDLPKVRGDRASLEILFQNLISNAIKYRRGDRRLRIEVTAEETDDHWVVRFADNGRGIDVARRLDVFEMFSRSSDEQVQGSGIGLATCRRIAERHGGHIDIIDGIDHGCCVRVHLPRRAGAHLV